LECSGSTQKQIEEGAGVKIIFPSSRVGTSVGIDILMLLLEIMFDMISLKLV
jgi:hypothetical protein